MFDYFPSFKLMNTDISKYILGHRSPLLWRGVGGEVQENVPINNGYWYNSSNGSLLVFFIFFLVIFSACKKEITPPTPGTIAGPMNICPGDSGIIYSINPVEGSSFYLWTVPDDAKIISGQGTTSILIKFGKTSGSVCVRSNNNKLYSEASCLQVAQGGVSNHWCREMNFKGGGRYEAVGFSIDNKGYIGTGHDNLAVNYNDFWEYDPVLNTWTQKANFGGVARFDAVGFAIGNKGYIGTGYTGTASFKDFWEYEPLSNQWQQKADCGDTVRAFAFGFSIGNKGYIGSGQDGLFSTRKDFLEYNPATDQWVKKAIIVKRNGGAAFSIGNKGYLATGFDGGFYHNDVWEYDPDDTSNGFDENNNPKGVWIPKAPFPGAARYAAIAFTIGDKGYVGTGNDGSHYFKDFFEFDPVTNSWLQKADFDGAGREFASGFAIQKNGYIGIGNTENAVSFSDFWVYGQ